MFASVLAAGSLGLHAQDSGWITWLREHHHALRPQAAGAADDFADLQFLKPVLEGRRIVQIGESHHSVAEYGAVKTRLIKFLHQEMGFDVLAFESSIYECFAADLRQLSATDALFSTIFGVWAFEEVLPLFEYLKQTQATARPLAFSGFDPQISSRTGAARVRRSSGAWWESSIPCMRTRSRCSTRNSSIASSAKARRMRVMSEDRLVAFYTRLAVFLEANRGALVEAFPGDASPLIAQRVAWSSVKLVQLLRSYRNNPDDASLQGHMAIRDNAMADNLTFLARELHPDRKIIVWAANIHVRHANAATTWVFPTMGQWLSERFRDELYTIGLYPNRGTVPGTRSCQHRSGGAGHLERLLSDAGSPQLFVDLLHQSRAAARGGCSSRCCRATRRSPARRRCCRC